MRWLLVLRAYCTMFDSGYLSRGIALIDSMRSVGIEEVIWVLCLDETARQYLDDLAIPGVVTVGLPELEAASPGLAATRSKRSCVEYYFTCTPALVHFVLDCVESGTWVVYLDADLWFQSSATRVFAEVENSEIGIVPHRFPEQLRTLEKYGRYNVAWVMFKNASQGRACAEWWRQSCIEWCFDRPEAGRYADQGYLDEFTERFSATTVVSDPGINLAPWNLARHELVATGSGSLEVDGSPLIFYHFHGLRKKGAWIYPNLATYRATLTTITRDGLYVPYIAALDAIERGAAAVNFGRPLPTEQSRSTTRNSRSVRSAAYRARRRLLQFRERRAGGAFRITDFDEDAMSDRRYDRS